MQIERCVVFSIKVQNSDEPVFIKSVTNILPQKWSYFKFNVITRIFVSCQGNFSGVPIRTEKGKNEHFFKTFLLTRVCEWLRNRLENHRILIAAYGIIGQGGNSGTSDKAHRYAF